MASRRNQLTGRDFDKLHVEYQIPGPGRSRWFCTCACGNTKIVTGNSLLTYNTTSCGCAQSEHIRKLGLANRTHGRRYTREYNIWRGMLKRCEYVADISWPNYGGRGIIVCDRWHKFENFFTDMGECPPKYSLDRKDPHDNYTPENCRWATMKDQQRNRRYNRLITALNKTQCVAAWVEETGIKERTITSRIENGWNTDRAVTQAVRKRK